ncbi:MAG: proton-conducting transporter membrane subunit [Methylocella sp.]
MSGAASYSPELLAAALGLPVIMLLGCLSPRLRDQMAALLALAPAPALVAALLAGGGPPLVIGQALVPMVFALDAAGAMLLGAASLLWIIAGAYAFTYMRGKPNRGRFTVCWLLTLIGSIGVFMAADVISFYLVFALVSLPAYGLIVDDDTPRSEKAGLVYIAFAVLGEAFLIIGFVLLASGAPGHSLLIRDGVAALSTSPWRDPALALLIAGFAAKIGLAPLHVWMPLSYRAAPIPAAAALSGAAVKAGVIGLIRFLPFDAALPAWGEALAALGMFTAFYGVAIGLTQSNPKTVLAYSSISQMGVIAAVLGMGVASGDQHAALATAFYAAHHVLVKGTLFLAIGVAAATDTRRLWLVLLPAAVLALSLAGLPFTGGALAKLVVKGPLGYGVIGMLSMLSAAATTLLMLHFLRRLALIAADQRDTAAPAGLTLPWLAGAAASIAVPWALYLQATGGETDVFDASTLWESFWPVLLGGAAALILRHWSDRLPHVPEGDALLLGERAAEKALAFGGPFDRADVVLRQWPAAALALLALALLLGAAMLAGH